VGGETVSCAPPFASHATAPCTAARVPSSPATDSAMTGYPAGRGPNSASNRSIQMQHDARTAVKQARRPPRLPTRGDLQSKWMPALRSGYHPEGGASRSSV